jgi:hypothetical protein
VCVFWRCLCPDRRIADLRHRGERWPPAAGTDRGPGRKKIKLTIRNEGPGPIEFENLDLRVEKVLAPGASSFLVIHPLKPGSYRFIDEFHAATGTMELIAK